MRRVLGAALLAIACRRTPVVQPDPTPPVDAAPAPPPLSPTRLALHGRIVDAASGAVVFPLREKLPRDEASDDRAAYVLDDDDTLRAYDLASGKSLWEVKTAAKLLARGTHKVFVGESAGVAAIERGTMTRVATATPEELYAIGDHALIRHGTGVSVIDPAGKVATISAPLRIETRIDDWRRGLIPTSRGFCVVVLAPPDHDLRCFELDAKEVVHTIHALAKPSDPSGTRFSLIAATAHHVLVGTFRFGASGVRRAAVVRLSDGKEVMRVEDELVAIVENAAGDLEGALTAEVKMYAPSGVVKWTYTPKWSEHFAKVLAHEDRLILARHHVIATGVEVLALRRTDGALLWTGETKLPPIGHSKYHNHVTLETRADAVILRGHESSVEHVHVYDLATGRLRFHDP